LNECGGCDEAKRQALEENERSRNHEGYSYSLRAFEQPAEHCAAADGIAPEFGDEKNYSGCHEKEASEIAILAVKRQPEYESNGNCEEAERNVGLDGVNGDVQGCTAPLLGKGVGIGDGPADTGAGAEARASEQGTDLFKGEAERRRCSKSVGGNSKLQMIYTGVNDGYGKRDESADGCDQRMMNHREAKHPDGMMAQYRPVCDDQEEARTDECGEEHENAEIPDFIGIDVKLARGVNREHKCKQDTHRSDGAIRRDDKRTDVEEDGMHLTKDTGSECGESSARTKRLYELAALK
jgi:hypothetical protein